jgi:hypothetical protein
MLGFIDVNGLSVFAEAGLVIFLIVFVAVTVRAIRTPRGDIRGFANLPLDGAGSETVGQAGDTNQGRGAL